MKAIITDLDRTLMHTDKSISPYTEEILNRCRQKGILIMVATARPERDIKNRVGSINFDAMTVSNGARVICGHERREFGIPTYSAVRLLEFLRQQADLKVTLETGDVAYSNVTFEDYESTLSSDLISVAKSEGVLKLLVGIDTENTVEDVKKELTDDLYYTVANGHLMQIMSREATKWNGIKHMLSLYNISPEDAVYFGDDNDDIEPIKYCGIGVAVENAIPSVLNVADRIVDSNDRDGVAKFIEEILL